MTIEIWSSEIIALATGCAITGIPTIAAGVRSENPRIKEPVFSAGLAFIYIPFAYGITWLWSQLGTVGWSEFFLLTLVFLAAHGAWLIGRYRRKHGHPESSYLAARGIQAQFVDSVFVSRSPKDYRELIVPAEHRATTLDRIPKRLSVVFKGTQTIRSIAVQRFGEGSTNVQHYLDEHEERTREFFASLRNGMICREIYSKQELKEYLRTGNHGSGTKIAKPDRLDNLSRWTNTIKLYPQYSVALTNEKLPFKYQVIDSKIVVMHEAIGKNDRGRLNAVAISSESVAEGFLSDFDLIWDRVPPIDRDPDLVIKWIQEELVPLCQGV